MMDWDKALTLLHVATAANDFPKLHDLRNAALAELEAMITPVVAPDSIEADTNGVRRA